MRAVVLPGMVEATGPDPSVSAPANRSWDGSWDQPPDAAVQPHRRRRRGGWVAATAVAAGLLIGPLAFTYVARSDEQSPQAAAAPQLSVTQPGPVTSDTPLPGQPAPSSAPVATSPAGSATRGPARTSNAPAPPTVVTSPPATSPIAAVNPVVKISGVGCANDLTQNWYTNGQDGSWSEQAGGAGGCGRFVSMPISGDPSSDGNPYVVWWFETSPVMTGTCAVSVYIPSGNNPNDVAGRPAHYKILGGRTSSTIHASFNIDQTANRGRWVSAGTFPVSNGAISIHLGNRGTNPNGERLGAAQAQVSCTPS